MLDSQTIKQAVHAALDERDGLDRETHRSHHEYIRSRLAHEQARDLRRHAVADRVKATVVGAVLVGLLSLVGTGLYKIGQVAIDWYSKAAPH